MSTYEPQYAPSIRTPNSANTLAFARPGATRDAATKCATASARRAPPAPASYLSFVLIFLS